jgi:hypothetical protein
MVPGRGALRTDMGCAKDVENVGAHVAWITISDTVCLRIILEKSSSVNERKDAERERGRTQKPQVLPLSHPSLQLPRLKSQLLSSANATPRERKAE